MTRTYRMLWLAILASLLVPAGAPAQARAGQLAGTVVDFAGRPQMGASVWITAQNRIGSAAFQSRTNRDGHFETRALPAGIYSVRVTLAGFLPAIDRNVRVAANLTTVLKLELDSVFSSMSRLRREPDQPLDADEWDWVLRASANTRPVLRWQENSSAKPVEASSRQRARARVELTSGSRESGMLTDTPFSPASAFAYDQSLGGGGRLILAGQFRYEGSASNGLAATWLPMGDVPGAPRTTVVVQQFRLGPGGPMFRGLRTEQSGQMELGKVSLRYGAQFVRMGFDSSVSTLRPRAEVAYQISPEWTATASAGARPLRAQEPTGDLETALAQFDLFPAVMFRDGHPLLEGASHDEASLEHRSGGSTVVVAVFFDSSKHTPVFARSINDPNDTPTEFLSFPQAVNGGRSSSLGTRAAYQQKIGNDMEMAFVYSWAGALSVNDPSASVSLNESLRTRPRHSVAAKLSYRVPRMGTHLGSSYKWINGSTVSRQDPYGEVLYDIDPFLNLSVRQPLPIVIRGGKLELIADMRNVLAQGYLSVNTADGRVCLIPARQMIRGGLSFQF